MTKLSRTRELVTSLLFGKKCETSHPPLLKLELDLEVRLTIAILRRLKQMSAALAALNANVAKLSADVDAFIAAQPPSQEPAIQAAADTVAAADAKIVAATPAQ